MSSLSFSLRDSRASETRTHVNIIQREKGEKRRGERKNEGLQTKPKLSCFSLLAASHLSRVPVIFTRARVSLALLTAEGGKTTTSSPRRFSLGKRGMLIVYNFYSSTSSCCSENSGSARRGTPVIRVELCSVLSGTHTIYKKLKQQHTRFFPG